MPELDVNENQGIYYGDGYWNELEPVSRMLSQRISSGDVGAVVPRLFRGHGKPFKRALILNCGNGWVEREMASANLLRRRWVDYRRRRSKRPGWRRPQRACRSPIGR